MTAVRFFERDWVFRMCTCKLFPFFFYANISISVFSLAGVALNRYVGLFYPHLMDTLFSRTKSALMVLLVWLCSFGKLTSLYTSNQTPNPESTNPDIFHEIWCLFWSVQNRFSFENQNRQMPIEFFFIREADFEKKHTSFLWKKNPDS